MRLVYEHIFVPGILVEQPTMLVSIQHNGVELGVYGFDICSEVEIGTGILCRACELVRCSMVDPELHNCVGVLKPNQEAGDSIVFVYDNKNFTFKPI